MSYEIVPTRAVKRAFNEARKDAEFRSEISKDDSADALFSKTALFTPNPEVLIGATLYSGWVLAKRGFESYENL